MRRYYLDNIRWMTVVLVVIYHVIYMFNGVQLFGVIGPFRKVQYQDAFLYMVYPWFMTLLFVVSGASARYYLENHSAREFIKTRTRKLLVPSTIGLFVFQWILGYFNMKISGMDSMSAIPKVILYFIMAMSGTGVLWYIQMLWIFSLLLVLVRKIEKDRLYIAGAKTNIWVLLLFTVLIYLSAQVLNTPMVTVYRFGIYGVGFLIGYFVMSHDEVVNRLSKYWLPLSIAAIALCITYTVLYFGQNYAQEPVINNILACVFCWIAILAVYAVMKKWADKTTPFFALMTKKSWGLYVFHYLPIAVFGYYQHLHMTNMPPALVYLIAVILAFAVAFVLFEIISRIPVVRWCVLGISGKKKKENAA